MDVDLRPLTHDDFAAYLERVAELDAVHREALPEIFRAPDEGEPLRTRGTFDALVDDPNALLLGAWVDGELAGFAHAASFEVEQRWIRVGRRYVLIDNLAVGPRWRRRGIGIALVDAVEAWARERGATQIELGVWEVNEGAMRFYERLGFESQRRHLARRIGETVR